MHETFRVEVSGSKVEAEGVDCVFCLLWLLCRWGRSITAAAPLFGGICWFVLSVPFGLCMCRTRGPLGLNDLHQLWALLFEPCYKQTVKVNTCIVEGTTKGAGARGVGEGCLQVGQREQERGEDKRTAR